MGRVCALSYIAGAIAVQCDWCLKVYEDEGFNGRFNG